MQLRKVTEKPFPFCHLQNLNCHIANQSTAPPTSWAKKEFPPGLAKLGGFIYQTGSLHWDMYWYLMPNFDR